MFVRETLSMLMDPVSARTMFNSADASVDLPEPVRPMHAVVLPPGMCNEILCSEGSR